MRRSDWLWPRSCLLPHSRALRLRGPPRQHDYELRVLSSPPSMVTGGDALVQLTIPRNVPLHKAVLLRNGTDITSTLSSTSRLERSPGW